MLVFTPDRMRLVQGAPALRRRYLDRVLARLWPALAEHPGRVRAGRLPQRNHLLRRLRAGRGAEEALVAWDDVLAEAGRRADRGARAPVHAAVRRRSPPRLGAARRRCPATRRCAMRPNVDGGAGACRRCCASAAGATSSGRSPAPGRTSTTSSCVEADRDLRRFGSQGEQRRALLALILAEADLLYEERGEQPLLLLDDVTSELDAERRGAAAGGGGAASTRRS